jgi:hypothetical protein
MFALFVELYKVQERQNRKETKLSGKCHDFLQRRILWKTILLKIPAVTDTWQDEMYYNEDGHTQFYGLPYMTSAPDDLNGVLICFPYCQGDKSNVIVTKAIVDKPTYHMPSS